MAETGLSGLHGLNTIKIWFVCHLLLGKSGLEAFRLLVFLVVDFRDFESGGR